MNTKDKDELIKFAIEQKLCEMSFYDFFKYSWHIVEPSVPLSTNWHHKYLCGVLQGEAERIIEGRPKTKDIVINVPFRSTKSLITTVLFPVWCWIRDPKLRFITASYSADLSIEHATKSRDVIQSDWFIERWGEIFHIKKISSLSCNGSSN